MQATFLVKSAAIILLLGGPVAWGGPGAGVYQSASSGDWAALSTWEIKDASTGWRPATVDDGVPEINDAAVIGPGHTVTVSGAQEVGKLRIERGTDQSVPGVLQITDGGFITIGEGLKMPQRPRETAAGRIVFSGTGRVPGVLESLIPIGIGGDIEVTGDAGGIVRTQNPAHLLSIGRFSRITASGGPLTLGGALSMDGTVVADGPHSVRVTGDAVRPGSSGEWIIAHPQAQVSFETTQKVFLRSGEIDVRQGTLDLATDFEAAGVTRGPDGRINVHEGKAFSARQLREGREIQPAGKEEVR